MTPTAWQAVFVFVVLGHFGLHLSLYNRLNSLGWKRKTIKRVEKLLFVEMWVTLLVVPWIHPVLISDWIFGTVLWQQFPSWMVVYGGVCLSVWLVFGIPWLLWRPIFRWEWADAARQIETVDVQAACRQPLALTRKCRFESRLPFNQIFDLSIERVTLPVPGLPQELDGFRIAHLSDIHLTGQVAPDYAKYAVQRATDWQPDLIALTGDIIDKQPCIDWLPEIFSVASAPDGCYFVLGNHDTRVVDSWQTREAMDRAGWTDVGSRALVTKLRNVPTQVIGNEYPWFERPELPQVQPDVFRMMISHSPDQIRWARRHDIRLMLAGHTHGGQGRLPLAGPILSPSIHGSRFASGDFYLAPTTMHVSRGIGGVHLLRINCRPELSLLVLKAV
ncbi:MAG: metallophosphoesterase [Planctomycetota bacterium]